MYGSIPGLSIPSHSNRNRTQAINVSNGYNFKFSSNHILKGRQLLDCYINNTSFSQPVPICTVSWMNPAWQTQRWGVNEICMQWNKAGSVGPQAGASAESQAHGVWLSVQCHVGRWCQLLSLSSSLWPLDCGPPGSSVPGISQARTPFSRRSYAISAKHFLPAWLGGAESRMLDPQSIPWVIRSLFNSKRQELVKVWNKS